MRGKHPSLASPTLLDQGPNLQPRHVPWPGIEPVTHYFAEGHSTNSATLVRAPSLSLFSLIEWNSIFSTLAFRQYIYIFPISKSLKKNASAGLSYISPVNPSEESEKRETEGWNTRDFAMLVKGHNQTSIWGVGLAITTLPSKQANKKFNMTSILQRTFNSLIQKLKIQHARRGQAGVINEG